MADLTIPARLERHRSFRAGWPIAVLTAGMPVLFAVGLQGLAWSLPFVVFGFGLLARPYVRIPRGVGWLILLVGWCLLTAVQLHGTGTLLLFLYRWSLFAGTLACVLWVANIPERLLPSFRIERWLALLWIWLMLFGLWSVVMRLDTMSPIQYLLGGLGRTPFVDDISRWRLAEVQTVLRAALPRPSAPFPKTNGWGAAVGLLAPFFIKVWLVDARGRRRVAGIALLGIGLIPMAYSVDRGMLLSVAAALVYMAVRRAFTGDVKALVVLVVSALVITTILMATGGVTIIADRLTKAGDSDATRGSVYQAAIDGAKESPLIGHGAPGDDGDPNLPPVGTHGLIWYLMYVHGLPALLFLFLWLGGEIIRSGRIRGPDDWWPHLSLVIAGIQVSFYGLLPQIVLIGIAAGLARRRSARGRLTLVGEPATSAADRLKDRTIRTQATMT